ncbi:hypothetical protein O1611_g10600 [Lasiodiplodia mahajangana]|uniref:Uncharacterized protein n=1 Tax=Lasiodiplodia mahajangana TaxID=1108764 RepID=A0ACC2IWA8_9PEZI|nr:hypothetical protein O1611_g10600 [Lasiodiplodia mahajangana]
MSHPTNTPSSRAHDVAPHATTTSGGSRGATASDNNRPGNTRASGASSGLSTASSDSNRPGSPGRNTHASGASSGLSTAGDAGSCSVTSSLLATSRSTTCPCTSCSRAAVNTSAVSSNEARPPSRAVSLTSFPFPPPPSPDHRLSCTMT